MALICLNFVNLWSADLEHPARFGFSSNYYLNSGLNCRQIEVTTSDGCLIKGWHHSPTHSESGLLFIYLHGNAGNRGFPHRVELMKILLRSVPSNVISFDYRGFGDSSCFPSQQGLVEDVKAIVSYGNQRGFKNDQIVLVGHSLGSGVALEAAKDISVKGIILLGAYTSIEDAFFTYPLAKKLLPILLMPFLRDFISYLISSSMNYKSIENIKKLKTRLLLIHGKLDYDIPYEHSKALFEAKNEIYSSRDLPGFGALQMGQSTWFLSLFDAGHNNHHLYDITGYIIKDFVQME